MKRKRDSKPDPGRGDDAQPSEAPPELAPGYDEETFEHVLRRLVLQRDAGRAERT